jgi:uncharacterized protein YodC (DUF2158 family)
MAIPKFEVGDAVRLSSANIDSLMTINYIMTKDTSTHLAEFTGYYECIWLNADKEVKTYEFKQEVLVSASMKKSI